MKTITMTTRELRSPVYENSGMRLKINELKYTLLIPFVLLVLIAGLQPYAAACEPPLADSSAFSSGVPVQMNEAISAMLASPDPLVVAEGHHLKGLAFNLNPTGYVKNGVMTNPGGQTPRCIDIKASSISSLYAASPLFRHVEFITVRIESSADLATVVDLASLRDFPGLKYIYFLCTFEICSSPGCEAAMISKMVQGSEHSTVLTLYKISIAN